MGESEERRESCALYFISCGSLLCLDDLRQQKQGITITKMIPMKSMIGIIIRMRNRAVFVGSSVLFGGGGSGCLLMFNSK